MGETYAVIHAAFTLDTGEFEIVLLVSELLQTMQPTRGDGPHGTELS